MKSDIHYPCDDKVVTGLGLDQYEGQTNRSKISLRLRVCRTKNSITSLLTKKSSTRDHCWIIWRQT
ncbi:hypothetical protein SCLCIDRAFT_1207045 [Scleroderma citrinum Foug A]|uniref:Uncharacterized protein n=1 Tax=Scleroderma citrinum Foug A TaxID=1036808 RepID=A0A0C3AAQ8_9AGAM|nr:hypothetical protein SCLCIDRAFT_1207045 [Scleroderma citrinum Foug A]